MGLGNWRQFSPDMEKESGPLNEPCVDVPESVEILKAAIVPSVLSDMSTCWLATSGASIASVHAAGRAAFNPYSTQAATRHTKRHGTGHWPATL